MSAQRNKHFTLSPELIKVLHGLVQPQPRSTYTKVALQMGKDSFSNLAIQFPSLAPAPSLVSATSTGRLGGETEDGKGKSPFSEVFSLRVKIPLETKERFAQSITK